MNIIMDTGIIYLTVSYLVVKYQCIANYSLHSYYKLEFKIMSRHKQPSDQADNLKIGDTVLLFYNADRRFSTDSGGESGYVLPDLSG